MERRSKGNSISPFINFVEAGDKNPSDITLIKHRVLEGQRTEGVQPGEVGVTYGVEETEL